MKLKDRAGICEPKSVARTWPSCLRSGPMKGLLACLLALVAGCSFDAPELPSSSTDAAPGPGADAPRVARCKMTYQVVDEERGRRYQIYASAMSWQQAKEICEYDGGYLLKLDNSFEDNGAALIIEEQIEVWIGLHDIDQDGAYVWLDGTPPAFTRWSGTPNAASPDCVVKNTLLNDGRWYTRDCAEARPAVCECELRAAP